jgi:transcriptional regulator with XRE-family HTH domain
MVVLDGGLGSGYGSDMNRLKRYRLRAGLSQAQLAKAAGTSQPQIRRLESDQRELTLLWAEKLAQPLNISPFHLLFDAPMCQIVGYVGAGAVAHLFSDGQGPFGEAPLPPNGTNKTVAVEIRGDSLGAVFNNWYAYYDNIQQPPAEDLLGHLCVVAIADGRVVIKKLERGTSNGRFNLGSDSEPIYNAEVLWAARVKALMPKDF